MKPIENEKDKAIALSYEKCCKIFKEKLLKILDQKR